MKLITTSFLLLDDPIRYNNRAGYIKCLVATQEYEDRNYFGYRLMDDTVLVFFVLPFVLYSLILIRNVGYIKMIDSASDFENWTG